MATLYILGAGNPTPIKNRFGSSYVLNVKKDYLMIDCGPASTHKLVKAGLFPTQVNYLFFTHHHSDHNADYPCFLLCRWDQSTGKEEKLNVYGPPPTEWLTKCLIGENGAFSHDLNARINNPLSQRVHLNRGGFLPRPGISLQVKDVSPGKICEGEKWIVTAAQAEHQEPHLISLAYRVDTDNGSIVFTGDTKICESIKKIAHGANVIVLNCTSSISKNLQQISSLAVESGVEKIILTHLGPQSLAALGSKQKALRAISDNYKGKVIFSEELMKIKIL